VTFNRTQQERDLDFQGIRVLVTGADGFIGSHLCEALIERGAIVTALCMYNSFDSHGWLDDLPGGVHPRLTPIRGDVRDAAFLRRIVRDQDIVFHLAALIAIPHSYVAAQSYVETNVAGTLNVLEAARESDVQRIVHTSTSEVYGTAITVPISESHPLQGQSPYSASKIGADMMAESFARSFGLRVAILRPFNAFGPRQSERAIIPTVIRQMLDPDCRSVRIGALTTVRDFTFVADTVAAFLAIGRSPNVEFGRPYNAGTGKTVSIGETIALLSAITACDKPIEQNMDRLRPDNSEVLVLQADSSRLAEDAGWRPRIEFRDGLARTVAWWRHRLASGRVRAGTTFMT
jgi:NAD dependent epimerase/dehydratase